MMEGRIGAVPLASQDAQVSVPDAPFVAPKEKGLEREKRTPRMGLRLAPEGRKP